MPPTRSWKVLLRSYFLACSFQLFNICSHLHDVDIWSRSNSRCSQHCRLDHTIERPLVTLSDISYVCDALEKHRWPELSFVFTWQGLLTGSPRPFEKLPKPRATFVKLPYNSVFGSSSYSRFCCKSEKLFLQGFHLPVSRNQYFKQLSSGLRKLQKNLATFRTIFFVWQKTIYVFKGDSYCLQRKTQPTLGFRFRTVVVGCEIIQR